MTNFRFTKGTVRLRRLAALSAVAAGVAVAAAAAYPAQGAADLVVAPVEGRRRAVVEVRDDESDRERGRGHAEHRDRAPGEPAPARVQW